MSNEQKAMAAAGKLFMNFDNCVFSQGSRYWKDKSLFEFEAGFKLAAERNAFSFIQALEKLAFLTKSWNILMPSDFDNGGFSGICNTGFEVDAISWASFEIVTL